MTQRWRVPVAAVLYVCFLAFAGSALTEVGPWYRGLAKPVWNPPDWAFGVGWTTIFALLAWSITISWRKAAAKGEQKLLAGVIVANGVLNVMWSSLFFFLKRPVFALYESVFLWLSVAALLLVSRKHDRFAGLLIVPYLSWVTFAMALNYTLVGLN